MEFVELLKSLELTDEQVAKVTEGMKENGIHLSSEENIDERYGKLKGQHQQASDQLQEAQALIEELKKGTADNEEL